MKQDRERAALCHLVFDKGMSIDAGMEVIAESHPSTVKAWERRGRSGIRAFLAWCSKRARG